MLVRSPSNRLAERAGFESGQVDEFTAFVDDSRGQERPRDDVSTRMLVGARPSEMSLASSDREALATAIAGVAHAPSHSAAAPVDVRVADVRAEVREGADSSKSDMRMEVITAPTHTIRDDLAELVARAVREGELDLASRLIEVIRAQRPAATSSVVDLATERARRGDK